VLLVERRDRVYVADADHTLAAGDRLYCLGAADATSPLAAFFKVIDAADTQPAAQGQIAPERSQC